MLFSFFVYLSSTLKYNQNDIIYQEIKKQWPSKQLNSICNHFDIPNSFPSFVLGNIFNTEEESCRMLESIIRKTNGDVSRFFYDPKSPISFRAFLSADKIIEIENSTIPFNNNQDIPRPNNNNNHKNIDFLNLENISDFVQEYSWEHFGNWSLSDVITKSKRRLAFIIYDNFSIIDGFRFIALEQSQRFLFGNIHIETVHKKLGKHSMSTTELPALIVSDNYHKKFLIQSNIIADSFFSAFLNDVARRKHDNKMFQHLEVFLNDQDSSASAIVLTLAICSFVLLSLLLLMGFAISGADFKFDTLMKKEINSDTCLTLYRENAEQVDETDPSDI